MSVSIENLTSAYLNVRNERSQLSAKFKKADAELIEAQNQLKAAMLEYCEEHGVESVRTSEGLVYKTSKEKYGDNSSSTSNHPRRSKTITSKWMDGG